MERQEGHMTTRQNLRQLVAAPDLLVAPGAYDGATARLVASAGFAAVYMTGAGVSSTFGLPDYGLLGLAEMAARAGLMAGAVEVPLIADADTGYGNELNVTRTVREYERAGVAALHIEDQVSPKRCGHLAGKQVVARDEYLAKIRAAVAARRDPDLMIIARTDARATDGLEEALARANLAVTAGADMVFVEATRSLEEAALVPKRVNAPCLLNMVIGGITPVGDTATAQAMGYSAAILPGAVLAPVMVHAAHALRHLKEEGRHPPLPAGTGPESIFRALGSDEWDALRNGFDAQFSTTKGG
jgi:2-methylisocitrate lyase-like PEP mutase family enzyme